MISIHSAEENEFIRNYVEKQPSYSTRVWIGMKRNITQGFQWINKSPFDYSKWNINEPNGYRNFEPYVEMFINVFGFWNDCTESDNAFICEINYNNE
jgi:hypothetical protein